MYSIYDYAYNGLLYLNNMMRPRHKRLSQLMIYSTTACQSRCKHCNIAYRKWKNSLLPLRHGLSQASRWRNCALTKQP